MSYGRELAEEMWIDYDIWFSENMSQINKGIWTKRDGETISIYKMTNSHIQNCINMLNKQISNGTDNEFTDLWVNRFKKELEFRQYIKDIINGNLD